MIFNVYTVEDTKAHTFSAPFMQREGAVSRTLSDMFSKSPLNPKEFVLYHIGTFDNETGDLSMVLNKDLERICLGSIDVILNQEVVE